MLDTVAESRYNSLCQAKRLGTISGLRWGRMEQLLYLSALFDFYGALLTEKQQECLKMHLFEDFPCRRSARSSGFPGRRSTTTSIALKRPWNRTKRSLGSWRVTRRSARCSRTSAARSRPCGRMPTALRSAISSRGSCLSLVAVNMAGRYDF